MPAPRILIVGATGSIGRLAVAEAHAQGYRVRALVRDADRAGRVLPGEAELVVGDLTEPDTLAAAVDDIDAMILTHGAGSGEDAIERIDYGGLLSLLRLVKDKGVRIVLMSALGGHRPGGRLQHLSAADWKRRGERLVRAGGQPYTIVRPGWFDANASGHEQLLMRQGDTHHAGDAGDGAVPRRQIAQVLIASLSSELALGKTFELVTEPGPATGDLSPLFAGLLPDDPEQLDGPLDGEPHHVTDALDEIRHQP